MLLYMPCILSKRLQNGVLKTFFFIFNQKIMNMSCKNILSKFCGNRKSFACLK